MQIDYIFCYTLAYLSQCSDGVLIEKKTSSATTNSIWNCVGQMSCRLNVIIIIHNDITISMLLFLFQVMSKHRQANPGCPFIQNQSNNVPLLQGKLHQSIFEYYYTLEIFVKEGIYFDHYFYRTSTFFLNFGTLHCKRNKQL